MRGERIAAGKAATVAKIEAIVKAGGTRPTNHVRVLKGRSAGFLAGGDGREGVWSAGESWS